MKMMTKMTRRMTAAIALGVGLMAVTAPGMAQTGGDYELTWWSIDSGAWVITGGDYVLVGSVGQPDAGAVVNGGDYSLTGGFLAGKPEEPGAAVAGWELY